MIGLDVVELAFLNLGFFYLFFFFYHPLFDGCWAAGEGRFFVCSVSLCLSFFFFVCWIETLMFWECWFTVFRRRSELVLVWGDHCFLVVLTRFFVFVLFFCLREWEEWEMSDFCDFCGCVGLGNSVPLTWELIVSIAPVTERNREREW